MSLQKRVKKKKEEKKKEFLVVLLLIIVISLYDILGGSQPSMESSQGSATEMLEITLHITDGLKFISM